MVMKFWAQNKEIPQACCWISCSNCRYNRLCLAILWVWLFPLPRHQMYTTCSWWIQSPTSRPRERRNNEIIILKGIKKIPIMLVGGKWRIISQSIGVISTRRTTLLTCALGLRKPRCYYPNNRLLCWQTLFHKGEVWLRLPHPHARHGAVRDSPRLPITTWSRIFPWWMSKLIYRLGLICIL